MYPILFKIGPLTLHTYGMFVALGFLAGFYVLRQQFDRQGLDVSLVDNLAFLLLLGGLFGARLAHFVFAEPKILFNHPLTFFRIWEGGLVFYGALLVGLVILILYARYRELPLLALFDAFSAPMLIAHALGRLGCFSAGCCYGKPTASFAAVTFTHPESLAPTLIPLHPTQLYSSLGNLTLFGLALALSRRNPPQGSLIAFYLLGYGTFRFLIEFIRNDYRGPVFGGLFPSQWISIGLVITGLLVLIYVKKTSAEK